MSSFTEFENQIARINDVCSAIGLLIWDSRTLMPTGGNETRGWQVSTLNRIANQLFTSLEMKELIRNSELELAALNEKHDSYRWLSVQRAKEAYEIGERIPADLSSNLARLKSVAPNIWAQARQNGSFIEFLPILKEMMSVQRQVAEAIGYSDHPYNALLTRFEPGMTTAKLNNLFSELKTGIFPLLERVRGHEQPNTDFLTRHYPINQQRDFAMEISQEFGYDLSRGRLDPTVHPFSTSFTCHDVRITTRYDEHFLPMGLFGILHETGHAIYEQNIDPNITRTSLGTDLVEMSAMGGTSMGVHESQSRFWENMIGRSRIFWKLHFPRLEEYFPVQLQGITFDHFYRAINRVHPSFIRVEADEVTYNLHILMRVEIEMGLIAGEIKEEDLPEIWNKKMKEYLGIVPTDDRVGILQDQHWSSGHIGNFSNYMIGNLMAAQFYEAANQQIPNLNKFLEIGNYKPLLNWLTENIYRHGKAFTSEELLIRVTGRSLSSQPFLNYISQKYKELYP